MTIEIFLVKKQQL